MAKYSMKKGGKEVGSASVYAEPHTMTGKKVSAELGPEKDFMNSLNPSAGSAGKALKKEVKTTGIKIRGTGAATKGVMARGPMA